MDKNKGIDPLPDSFATEEEAGAFWDAHSTSDYEEYLEPAEDVIEIRDRIFRGTDRGKRFLKSVHVAMLTLLSISNIALIDELRVEFDHGLNLLTGETGSGKSIIVDALGVLIGARFTSDLLKSGSERAFIEGLFSVARSHELQTLLAAAGIEITDPQKRERRRR